MAGTSTSGRKPLYDEIKLKRLVEQGLEFIDKQMNLPGGSKNKDFDKVIFDAMIKIATKAIPQQVIQDNNPFVVELKTTEDALKKLAE